MKTLTKLAVSLPLAVFLANAPTALSQSAVLEEILVTAQKRSESAQDVPIALTAVSGEGLKSAGIASHDELTAVTPGLQYYRGVSSATPYIRGVGAQATSMGNESSVATYIDGFYIRDMVGASQSFNNIERVEVLKGPQGTLFGRNATGGVIQTITKTPQHETEAILGLTYGRYDTKAASFYGTTGLGENVAVDINVAVQRQGDGVGKNLTTGLDVGLDEYSQFSSKMVVDLSDATELTTTLQYNEKDNDIGMLRTCVEGAICLAGVQASPNFTDTFDNDMPFTESEGWLLGAEVSHQFENHRLVSLTSYQQRESFSLIDQDMGPLPLVRVPITEDSETYSQEFQLFSEYDGALQWIAGAFYWQDKAEYAPAEAFQLAENPPNSGNFGIGFATVNSLLETESYAVFGQVDYDFSDATTLTVGLRWTQDEKSISGQTVRGFNGVSGPPTVFIPDTKTFTEPTWRLALSHDFSDDMMAYVSYNRGFKSGTYNTFLTDGIVQGAIDPEILDAYAVGMKGDFLDSRLRVNAELFFYQFDNVQLQRIEGPSTRIENAAEAEVKGLEVSATALLSDTLSLVVNYARLDAEYSDFPNCTIFTPSVIANGGARGNLTSLSDCSDNSMINSPEDTVGVILNHNLLTSVGTIDSSITYYYNSGYFVAPGNRHEQPSYSTVNVNVGWASDSEKYEIDLYGKNITDEKYSSYRTSSSIGDTVAVNMYPVEYGVTLTVHF